MVASLFDKISQNNALSFCYCKLFSPCKLINSMGKALYRNRLFLPISYAMFVEETNKNNHAK